MTPIPMVDLVAQHAVIGSAVRQAIERVIAEQGFVLGAQVAAFEQAMAERVGVAGAVGVGSGSDALFLALRASGAGPGAEVVTTPLSFFATAGAIARAGATPVFADIEDGGFNLDPEAALAECNRKTRAVLPVHLFGRCAILTPIVAAAERDGFSVIEDCAQAIDARGEGAVAGARGHFGCFSFFPAKNLGAYGDGGLVVARDETMLARVRRLRAHGAGADGAHAEIGINSRLDALQAAVLRAKLAFLDGWTAARRERAHRYRALLSDLAGRGDLALLPDDPGCVHHQFTIRCPRRDALAEHLRARGVACRVYYPRPLHLEPCFSHLGYREGSLPRAERACREVLSLPMFPELTLEQQERVAHAVGSFFGSAR